jgi:hypothetical protein
MVYPEERINELIEETKELNRTLRGFNGTPGLVTQVTLLSHQVGTIANEVRRMNENGCNFIAREKLNQKQNGGDPTLKDSPDKSVVKDSAEIEEHAITFRWLIEKLTVPIAVAIVIGVINAIAIAKFIAPLIP